MRYKNLKGLRFGQWFVLENTERVNRNNKWYHLCKCNCGVIKEVNQNSLRNGKSKSCGCMKNQNYWNSQTWNTAFFSKRDFITSYWSGFLYADGNVRTKGNCLKLEISILDIEHLKLFCTHIGVNHDRITYITTDNNEKFLKPAELCAIRLYHPQIKKDLEYWGVFPRKGSTWIEPQCKSIDELRGFVTGLIDGDGSINTFKNRHVIYLAISGETPELIKWLNDFALPKIGFNYKILSYKVKNENWYAVYLALNKRRCRWLYEALKPYDFPCLDRKWSKLKSILWD